MTICLKRMLQVM